MTVFLIVWTVHKKSKMAHCGRGALYFKISSTKWKIKKRNFSLNIIKVKVIKNFLFESRWKGNNNSIWVTYFDKLISLTSKWSLVQLVSNYRFFQTNIFELWLEKDWFLLQFLHEPPDIKWPFKPPNTHPLPHSPLPGKYFFM